ncbi:putative RNA-binding protein Luc7-like 2 [Trichonephila clavipes]|nr:putative RNA-binding protein Luc7-like 2 [Trichonephila clavipes]
MRKADLRSQHELMPIIRSILNCITYPAGQLIRPTTGDQSPHASEKNGESIDLQTPCFSDGQLYVACSRVGRQENLFAMDHLQNFINECDRRTEQAKRRLAETQEELSAEVAAKLQRVHELAEQIGKQLALAEKLGAEGNVEESMKTLEEVEKFKMQKVLAEQEYRNSMPASSYQQQKLRVCEVCSAYLGIYDNDRRLADHFGGKLHLGFIAIREKLKELKAEVNEKRQKGRMERDRDYLKEREERNKEWNKSDSSRSRRHRSPSSSRHRHRSRSEEHKKRSKHRRRSTSRERHRSRDGRSHRRERSRDRKDKIKRSRSKERRRSHSTGNDKVENNHEG